MAKSKKRKPVPSGNTKRKIPRRDTKLKKRRRIQFELVVPPNFLDEMYSSMASEQWELDHRRKPSDYIR